MCAGRSGCGGPAAGPARRRGEPLWQSPIRGEGVPLSGAHHVPEAVTNVNYYTLDNSLRRRLQRLLAAADLPWAETLLSEMGALAGGPLQPLSELANRHRPVLQQYDRRGERVDAIEFHPAYIEMSRLAYGFGLAQMNHRESFRGRPGPAPRLVTQAAAYLFCHAEQGLYCPICMTDAAVRSLRRWGGPELLQRFLPRLTTLDYDQLFEAAMFLTEKAGGSDVGANEVRAVPAADGLWQLWGEKWFCSNAGAQVALVLARPEGAEAGTRGLGLFLMPRNLADGSHNRYVINRLKDKLGTWSMASGEIELQGALAYPVTLNRGWVAMADMVNGTRQAIAAGTAGGMRRVFFDAREHARRRIAFGQPLDQHPLMRRQLIDILLDVEAAQALMVYTAAGDDRLAAGEAGAGPLVRLLTAVAKWYNSARAVPCVEACMEVLGGIGYIEEWSTARMFRDLSVNRIWEGTANIMFLDVLRSMRKEATGAALVADLRGRLTAVTHPAVRPLARALSEAVDGLGQRIAAALALADPLAQELAARRLTERMAPITVAVYFAAEAEAQAQAEGDGRGLVLTEAYLRRWLPDVATALGMAATDGADPDVERFAVLVDHAALPLG